MARKVADELERRGLEPAVMSAYLADTLAVERFSDLCYSHADAILVGLTKSVLADDLERIDPDAPARVYCPRCSAPHSDFDGLGPPCCDRCRWCPRDSLDGTGRCEGCGSLGDATGGA